MAAELQTEPELPVTPMHTFRGRAFVSNFLPWEIKTKARKKRRRHPNQSLSQSQAVAKYSRRRHRPSKALPGLTSNLRPRNDAERLSLSPERAFRASGQSRSAACRVSDLFTSRHVRLKRARFLDN